MKARTLFTLISSTGLLIACASGKQAPEQPVAAGEKTSHKSPAPRSDADSELSPDEPRPVDVPSAVTGPVADDLPPIPSRRIEQSRFDLSSLTEPPQMVVDGWGHSSKVRSVHFTSDGRHLVSAGYDKAVRVWSAESGALERTIRGEIGLGPAGRIYATALSQSDRFLAVGGWLGKDDKPYGSSSRDAFKIRVIDFYSGNSYRLLQGHSDVVLSLAFSHSGHRLLSGGGDRRARLWNAQTGRHEHTLSGHDEGVSAVAWSPNDRLVATGSLDHKVRIWEADSGREVAEIRAHSDAVTAVLFTPSGKTLVTGGADGTVRLWGAERGEALKTLVDVASPVGSLSISPDGLHVVVSTAGGDFATRVVNINTGKVISTSRAHDNVVLSSAVSPNGKWVAAAGGSDFSIAVTNLHSGKEVVRARGHGEAVWNVGFRRDGSSIAWGHDYDDSAFSQYQLNGALGHELPLARPKSPLNVVEGISHQADYVRAQERVAGVELRTPTGKDDAELQIIAAGRRVRSIRRDMTDGFVHRAFGLSPDATVVVSGGDNGVLTSYSATTGRKLNDFIGHTGDVLALAISPDGKRVVSGSSDQSVRLWELGTGNLLLTVFRARNREWVAFTPSGYYTASTYGDAYLGWHANRGAELTAAYFSAPALSSHLRFDVVVRQYLLLNGQIVAAIEACNRIPGQRPIKYYRFEDLPQFAPPEIYYLDPGSDMRVKEDRVKVTAKAYSPTSEPIVAMTFLINGRPIDSRWKRHAGSPRFRNQGREASLTATLPLPDKVNRITVIAENRYNQSEPLHFDVRREGGKGELEKLYQPDLHLLSVGVSNYGSPRLTDLRYANKDAEAISEALSKKNRSLYKKVHARILTEQKASRAGVTRELSRLTRVAEQKDVVLVFLSGYASKDSSGEYYFLPQDADPTRLKETAVAWSELRSTLEGLPSKVLLLIDSSHGGAISGSAGPDVTQLLRNTITPQSGLVVMTSSTGVESSYESEQWKHGAFTKSLLEGLAGRADYDHDRQLYIRELDHYVSRRVVELTEGRQHPTTEVPRSMPNFVLSER